MRVSFSDSVVQLEEPDDEVTILMPDGKKIVIQGDNRIVADCGDGASLIVEPNGDVFRQEPGDGEPDLTGKLD